MARASCETRSYLENTIECDEFRPLSARDSPHASPDGSIITGMAKSTPSKSARSVRDESSEPSTTARLIWVLTALLWATCVAALATYHPADPPGHGVAVHHQADEIANLIGRTGAAFSYEVFLMLGSGAWILAISLGAFLAHSAWRGPIGHPPIRLIGVGMLAIAFSAAHALLFAEWTSFPEGAGGLIGNVSAGMLSDRFGNAGAGIMIFALAAIGATVAYARWLIVVPAAMGRGFDHLVGRAQTLAGAAVAAAERAKAARVRTNDIDDDTRLKRVEQAVKTAAKRTKRKKLNETIDEDAGGLGGAADFDPDAETVEEDEYEYEYEDEDGEWEEEDAHEEEGDEEYEDEDMPGAPQVFDKETLKEKISKLPVRFAGKGVQSAKDEDLDAIRAQRESEEEIDKNYAFPGLDLLVEPEENFNEEMEGYVREQAEALEKALTTYKIDGEVVGIESGPVITLYQVALAPGTKVSSLNSVASDIARMLKAVNVRIVANTEGLDTVGIEVPNQMKEKVRLKELMANNPKAAKMRLPLFLGKDASGTPLVVDLASLPHMLIAGTTGSGKTVCMNAIIMGFLYTQKPSDLKLVLVDPKMVELSQFKDIPHLMCPVVTEMSKAAAILEWAVTKMDERYELLAEAGCRDIIAYNSLGWDELRERMNPTTELEEAKIPRKLPYMVFIIDELADLMMTNKEVESSIVRIAQKARAVGIHLILATQRPQANVVTGLIKSNMPGRVAFKVASGMDSRIVLDQKGGELLLGQGDMLMLTPRSSATMRAQGTLVDDSEIRNVVRFLRDHASSTFESQLVRIADHGLQATPEEHEQNMRQAAQEDPLFDRAVELVLETRRGSVSMLQRRLAIGYTRSARLIEMMGEAGIIGDHKGTVAREVTMTLEEWHAMKELAQAPEAEGDAGESGLFDAIDHADETDDELLTPEELDETGEEPAAQGPADEASAPEPEPPFEVEPKPAQAATQAAPTDEDPPVEYLLDEASAEGEETPEEPEAVEDDAEGEDEEEYENVDVDEEGQPVDESEDAEEGEDDEEYEYEYEYVDEEEDEETETA